MIALDALAACRGTWAGRNTLQDPSRGVSDESAASATVTPVLNGRFVRLDYTWSYKQTPQEGTMLVGFQKGDHTLTLHWADTWHTSDKVMACAGAAASGALTVRGSYAAPPGPDWGWRIDITPGRDALRLVMHNVYPDGKEERAVDTVLHRG
ncbi:MAG: DUF1579 family protein [Gemmatimonadaceae bacterium]